MGFFNPSNESLLIDWNQTNIEITQQITVINNKAVLEQIPDSFLKVQITGLTEIPSGDPTTGQYKVNYSNGTVTFDATVVNGTTFTAHYWGRGIIKYPSTRQFLTNKSGLYTSENVDDFADEISTKASSIQNQVDQLVVSGDSSVEAAQARVNADGETFATLRDRLNKSDADKADKSYVDSNITNLDIKINSQASGSPKGTYSTLSALQTAFPTGNANIYVVTADGKWYYWNGTTWTAGGIYQSTGIAKKSIDPKKTTFYAVSKNLINEGTISRKKILGSGGSLVTDVSFDTTDFIPLEVGSQYTLTKIYRYATFDESKVFKTLVTPNDATTTITAGAKFIKATYRSINADLAQIEEGAASTTFEPFYSKVQEVENQLLVNRNNFSILDFDYITGYVNPSTGVVTANTAGNMVSKLIELKKGETLKVSVYSQQSTVSVLSKWTLNGSPVFQTSLLSGNINSPNIAIEYTATEEVEYLRLGGLNDAQTKLDTIEIVTPTGGGGEAYDQSLNTTDDVSFGSVQAGSFQTTGAMPTGTLASPPLGLLSGDVWADTTDSATHPILRVML
jgi:hypothetical protein